MKKYILSDDDQKKKTYISKLNIYLCALLGETSDGNDDNDSDKNNKIPEITKYAATFSRLGKTFANFRMASYASDVGEATRGTFPNMFVNAMYFVTIAYIGTDLYFKYSNYHQIKYDYVPGKHVNNLTIPIYMGYHTLWHAQASLIFPSLSVHQIVNITKKTTDKISWLNPTVKRFFPAIVALSAIPLLIHPLDSLADFIMRHTYCKFYDIEP